MLHRNQRPEWKVNLYVSPGRGSVWNCLGGSDFQLVNLKLGKLTQDSHSVKGKLDTSVYL